jgi:bifunctional DNA-binding transcriptional regulator/antitoxin component of YhaV-PrlF toxin-antitoxin module
MDSAKSKIWSRVQPRGGTQIPEEVRTYLDLNAGDVLLWDVGPLNVCRVAKGKISEVAQEWPHKTSQ